ncbi:zinc finger protein 181-like [Contarinia nasturtii]|uniref:zinc finger protein 181-like n=1 Tax=Contarinia nasturtii TaxID=265458 RepID=UPI0012D3DB71|nr:zinc finger protein 181-like [Contarinia nasturtii]
MSKQCRLCAKFTESSIDLFLQHETTLLTKINSILPINITKDKVLPSKICCKCVERANATHCFIQEILLAQEVFGISSSASEKIEPTNSVKYGDVTISSMNQTAIHVPSPKLRKHKKIQNVSETLKKLKKMQTGMTISKTIVQGPKPMRKCKTKPKSYQEEFNGEDEFISIDDDDIYTEPDRMSSDSDDYGNDMDDDDDYTPLSKLCKTRNKTTKPNKQLDNSNSNSTDTSSKFKAIKINAPPVFLCMKCKNRFETLQALKQHVFQKNECTIAQLTCKVCNKTFDNKKRMSQHMKTHEERVKFICDKCGHQYANQFNLENHKSAMHGEYVDEFENIYKCRLCNEKYTNRTDLYSHMKTHTNDTQRQICETCGKCFNNTHNLKSHVRSVHLDIRPHECPHNLCNKRFRTRLLLRQHLHVHTGIKEFQCTACAQSFAKQDSLRIHMRKRHPDYQPNIEPPTNKPPTNEPPTEPENQAVPQITTNTSTENQPPIDVEKQLKIEKIEKFEKMDESN